MHTPCVPLRSPRHPGQSYRLKDIIGVFECMQVHVPTTQCVSDYVMEQIRSSKFMREPTVMSIKSARDYSYIRIGRKLKLYL